MAYPLLLTLPQRFPVSTRTVTVRQVNPEIPERRRYSTDPKTFHSLLSLAGEVNADKVSQAITRAVAQTMLADLCFLLFLTDDRSQIIIPSGYDLIREEKLDGVSILPTTIPMLASALQRGRALRLPASSTSGDVRGLSDMLGLSNPGHLLFVPILTAERQSLGGLLLLSPYSNRLWSAEDQSFLANIAGALAPIIQRSQQFATLEDKNLQASQAIEEERARAAELQAKNRELARQLEDALKQVEKYQETAENLVAMTTLQNEAQKIIAQLQAENEELRKAAQGLPTSKNARCLIHRTRTTPDT
jgi:GAF domain-containing protein